MKDVRRLLSLPPRVDANCQAVQDPRMDAAPGEAKSDSVPGSRASNKQTRNLVSHKSSEKLSFKQRT